MLPSLDWTQDEEIARTAWNGYLMQPGWDPVFGAAMMPFLKGSFDKLEKLDQAVRDRFCDLNRNL
jgi:hypothetical protein